MIHNLGSIGKNDLCFQSQERMNIKDSQYLQIYVQTYVPVND